jgi:hypothetical protein
MSRSENIANIINKFLEKNGLSKLTNIPEDMAMLYESAIRSIWQTEDINKRDTLCVDISAELKKYYGGKTLEELLSRINEKLLKEKEQNKVDQEKKQKQERMKDPNYIPSFDELMNS